MAFSKFESFEKYKRPFVPILRIVAIFLILFSAVYFILVPIRGMLVGVLEPWTGFFSIFLGVGIITVLTFWALLVHTRFGALMTFIAFVYWFAVPCNWIVQEWHLMQLDFIGTFVVMWINLVVIGLVLFLGLLIFVAETIYLKMHNKSIFWGPWVSKFTDIFKRPQFTATQKKKIKKGMVSLIVVVGICVPAFLSYSDLYTPPIEIRPQNYTVSFNFWAMPAITSSYDPGTMAQYNLSVPYNASILAELNEHEVNLDLTFGSFDNSSIASLVAWEAACPNITYRIVLTPGAGLATLPALVQTTVESIMPYEANGTLDQWKGLCFNIEGKPFAYNWNFTSFDEAVEMWDGVFDYIANKSDERGKAIDMECVSVIASAGDVKFDGDADLQKEYTEPNYSPDRWSLYAPMVYRCWYEGTKPYGSPMRARNPWDTSYQVYNCLYTLAGSYDPSQVGVYLGITNTSCYGRDLPQPEAITWGGQTGLYNLMRDVLICKHFGVKEVTFFLLFDAPENEYVMGGVFSSYGMDFLDIMNDTVNTNPPARFEIYYRQSDDKTGWKLRSDWLYDFSTPIGMVEMAIFWLIAIMAGLYLPALMKKADALRKPLSREEKLHSS
jgi:hypothetical protein